MARQREKIYRRKRPLRTFFKILGIVVAVLIVLAIAVFFWFQRYIQYTSEGVRLNIPFWEDILDDLPEDAADEPLPSAELIIVSPTPTPEGAEQEPEDDPVNILLLDPDETALTNVDWAGSVTAQGGDGLLLQLKDATGQLGWASEVALADGYGVNGDLSPAVLEEICEEVELSVLLCCFMDDMMASRNAPAAITDENGAPWESLGSLWMDPANEAVQDYITELCLELAGLGVSEIVLVGFCYPPDAPVDLTAAGRQEVVTDFLTTLASKLQATDTALSLLTEEADWHQPGESAADTADDDADDDEPVEPEETDAPDDEEIESPEDEGADTPDEGEAVQSDGPVFDLDLTALARIVDRFYCDLTEETVEDEARLEELEAAVHDLLGTGYVGRFIAIGDGSSPGGLSWVGQYGHSAGDDTEDDEAVAP